MANETAPLAAPQGVDLVEHPSNAPPAPNPLADAASVMVSLPESVEVKLVDAGVLADYEVWALLTGILSNAVIGFLVAHLQAEPGKEGNHLATCLVFLLLMVVTAVTGIVKRRRLGNAKRVRFRIGERIE